MTARAYFKQRELSASTGPGHGVLASLRARGHGVRDIRHLVASWFHDDDKDDDDIARDTHEARVAAELLEVRDFLTTLTDTMATLVDTVETLTEVLSMQVEVLGDLKQGALPPGPPTNAPTNAPGPMTDDQ